MHEMAATTPDFSVLHPAIADRWPSAVKLNKQALAERFPKRGIVEGWDLRNGSTPRDNLLLLFPEQYPYALPLVALAEQPTIASLPHVETDGVFCVAANDSLMELPADIRHAEFVIAEAVNVLNDGRAGTNRQDFLEEASTYWGLDQEYGKPFWLSVSDTFSTRLIWAKELGNSIAVAETPDSLKKFVTRGAPCKNLSDGPSKRDFSKRRLIPMRSFKKINLVGIIIA